jgi:RND family efflux transporter MFP subunit
MARRAFAAALGVVLVGALLALLLARRKAEQEAYVPSTRPAERAERAGERGPAPARLGEMPGVVVAAESVDVTATSEGRLEAVPVQVGDAVRRGAVVARLEVKPLERELEMAEAALLAARADEQVAALTLSESQERLERRSEPKQLSVGALSVEELATARYQERMAAARLEVARAQVKEREARVGQLRQRLGEALLAAPFDAVVARRYVDPGARVAGGQPIVHLLRQGAPRVRFALPEEQATRVLVGTPLRVSVPHLSLSLPGQVLHVAPEVDTASRRVLAIAQVEAPEGTRIPTGLVVRVSVEGGPVEAASRVP